MMTGPSGEIRAALMIAALSMLSGVAGLGLLCDRRGPGGVQRRFRCCWDMPNRTAGRQMVNFRRVSRQQHDAQAEVVLRRGGRLPEVRRVVGLSLERNPGAEFSDNFLNEWGVAVVSDYCPSREETTPRCPPRRDPRRRHRLYAPPLDCRTGTIGARRRDAGGRMDRAVRLRRFRTHLRDRRSPRGLAIGRGARPSLGRPPRPRRSSRRAAERLCHGHGGLERREELPGQPRSGRLRGPVAAGFDPEGDGAFPFRSGLRRRLASGGPRGAGRGSNLSAARTSPGRRRRSLSASSRRRNSRWRRSRRSFAT